MAKLIKMAQNSMRAIIKEGKGFDAMAKSVQVMSATDDGKIKFQWTVREEQAHAYGNLHGGYTSYMVDFTTTAALMAHGNKPGASVDLSVSFLRTTKIGEVVTMETDVKKVGTNLAFLEASLRDSKGDLIATGKQTRFIG